MEGVLLLFFLLLLGAEAQEEVPMKSFFAKCHPGNEEFDECVRDGINKAAYLMPVGAPEYQLPPLDPFYAKEVVHKRSGPLMQYKLKLKNVVESGWRLSTVTRFKSDLANGKLTYEQTFPDKVVSGDYEFEGTLMPLRLNNKGKFKLSLYDYNQTTTITMRRGERSADGLPLNVRIVNTGVRDMKIYISNLLRPNTTLNDAVDSVINASWRPFFPFLRPAIDDMVSSAFTRIFSRAFAAFPFHEVFRPAP